MKYFSEVWIIFEKAEKLSLIYRVVSLNSISNVVYFFPPKIGNKIFSFSQRILNSLVSTIQTSVPLTMISDELTMKILLLLAESFTKENVCNIWLWSRSIRFSSEVHLVWNLRPDLVYYNTPPIREKKFMF